MYSSIFGDVLNRIGFEISNSPGRCTIEGRTRYGPSRIIMRLMTETHS